MTEKELLNWLGMRKVNIHYHKDVMSNDEMLVMDWRIAGHWLSVSSYISKESLAETIGRAVAYERTCTGGLLVA